MVVINLGGISGPLTLKKTKKCGGSEWWDKTGDFDSNELGIDERENYTRYTTPNLREAQIFANGARCLMNQIIDIYGSK